LANEYDISEGMVSDILKEKYHWLSVDTNSYQANLKCDKKIPFPLVEEALVIWVDNAFKASLIITDDILSTKAL
ncbi:4034_t:CDS:1, partial [Funneliformis geosporum]